MTGRDLITASLRLVGAVAPGEALAAQEATDGLAALNRMLSAWSAESLLRYNRLREEFTLTPGTSLYTMGPSGTFNTTRPIEIEAATLKLSAGSNLVETPLRIIKTSSEWADVRMKTLSSPLPVYLMIEDTFPLMNLDLYPVPSTAGSIVIYSSGQLTQLADLSTSISLPPGYEEALVYNLATRLAPEYGRQSPAEVVAIAVDSVARLKRRNEKMGLLKVDTMLRAQSQFNIYTGENQ